MINEKRLIQWMNVVRGTSGSEQFRLLENFWESQITSKIWLLDNIKHHCAVFENSDIYIFGGWYGILAQLLADKYPNSNIFSIDVDDTCVLYGQLLKLPHDKITFITDDMMNFKEYSNRSSLIINTSTEHVSQEVFNTWLSHVPNDIPVALQGNNFFECKEHIRCCIDIEEFKMLNPLRNYLMQGSLRCNSFIRWMTIGYQ
jgi:trans-aconitate methyltransferase